MAKRDYYDVLGISKNADEKEIKRAYRALAKKYHPDANAGNAKAEQQFKEVTEAYDVLGDKEKRKRYDQYGFAAFDENFREDDFNNRADSGWKYTGFGDGGHYTEYHFQGEDMDDMFSHIFGSGFHRQTSRKGRDLEAEISISFEEAAFGCKKRFSLDGNVNGSVEVQVPAGIDEGQSVRLKGKGYPGYGGMPNGDLYLKVHIIEKAGWERKGMDVYTTENIPYTTAALGGETVFHTLYGDVKCKIPAGTQSGSKIRLKQKGIVSMKNPQIHGDAYIVIQIAVPRSLTERERKILQELESLRYRNVG